jgi:hypothetical protein
MFTILRRKLAAATHSRSMNFLSGNARSTATVSRACAPRELSNPDKNKASAVVYEPKEVGSLCCERWISISS